jgi:hypothetical protein
MTTANNASAKTPEGRGEAEYEVTWPDGSVYRNRHGQTRLAEAEAKMTAPRIGGTWRRAAPEQES